MRITVNPFRLKEVLHNIGFEIKELTATLHCPRIFAVILGRLLEKHASPKFHKKYLNSLMSFERLGRLPTRFLTGYFSAVKAVKK